MDRREEEEIAELAAVQEMRVEHIIAAVDQIMALCVHVRGALESLDPLLVVKLPGSPQDLGGGGKQAAGRCAQVPFPGGTL